MVLTRIKRGVDRFLNALDSEGVGIFQAVVYLHLAAGGLYCIVFANGEAPEAVERAMGPVINSAWLWLCTGAVVCMVGKLLSGRPEARPYWVHTTGLLMQLAGDLFACGAFSAYVLATYQVQGWGKPLVAVWVFIGLAECALLLVIRDLRRYGQAEREVRR